MKWSFKAIYIVNEHFSTRTIEISTKDSQTVRDAWIIAARIATEDMSENSRLYDITIVY